MLAPQHARRRRISSHETSRGPGGIPQLVGTSVNGSRSGHLHADAERGTAAWKEEKSDVAERLIKDTSPSRFNCDGEKAGRSVVFVHGVRESNQ